MLYLLHEEQELDPKPQSPLQQVFMKHLLQGDPVS